MTASNIPSRVAAGVAWLDANVPGWVERIDLERLAMWSCTQCVLGQLFGDFNDAPAGLIDGASAVRNGFDVVPPEEYWAAALEAEWRQVIEQRRAAVRA